MAHLRQCKPQVTSTVVPWGVYPRAGYFKNRLIGVCERLENFASKSPFEPEFLDGLGLSKMHSVFSGNINVVVYSDTRLGTDAYVTDARPLESWKPSSSKDGQRQAKDTRPLETWISSSSKDGERQAKDTSPLESCTPSSSSEDEEQGLTVYIEHLKPSENRTYRWLFQILMGRKKEETPVLFTPPVNRPHFIAVDFTDQMSPERREEFLKSLEKRSNIEGDEGAKTHICMVKDNDLSKRIEEYLEDQVMACFSKISSRLNEPSFSCVSLDRHAMHILLPDLMYKLEKEWYNPHFHRVGPGEIEHIFVANIARTFHITHKAAMGILEEIDFHDIMQSFHFSDEDRIEEKREDARDIMLHVCHGLEEQLQPIRKHAEMLKKFDFEIHRYLQQTTIEGRKPKLTSTRVVNVPEKMRSELLALDSVYSVATVFGQFEIHLYDKKLHSDKIPMKSTNIDEGAEAGSYAFPQVDGKPEVTDVVGDQEVIETKLADITPFETKNIDAGAGSSLFADVEGKPEVTDVTGDQEIIETLADITTFETPVSCTTTVEGAESVSSLFPQVAGKAVVTDVETKLADTTSFETTNTDEGTETGSSSFPQVEVKPVVADEEETTRANIEANIKKKMSHYEARRLVTDAPSIKAIDTILQRHNFNSPYSVKLISCLTSHHYGHGNAICCPRLNDPDNGYRAGTLGCFIEGQDKGASLYGLTCAHVVNSNEDDFKVFLLNEDTEEQILFATSSPRMTIAPGSRRDFPFVDFAAIKVAEPFWHSCIRELKDIDGYYRPYEVFSGRGQESAVGRCVHKYGATTDLTEGIVASTDMRIAGPGVPYLVLVEPLPGSGTDKFSDCGDSGAITCMMNPTQPNTVTALSMVSGGDMMFRGETLSYTLSFMLQTGLDLLNSQAEVRLYVPQQ